MKRKMPMLNIGANRNWSMHVVVTQCIFIFPRKPNHKLTIGAMKVMLRMACSFMGCQLKGPVPTTSCAVALPAMPSNPVCKMFIVNGRRLSRDSYRDFSDTDFVAFFGVGLAFFS